VVSTSAIVVGLAVLGLYILIVGMVVGALLTKAEGSFTRLLLVLVLAVLIASPVYLLIRIQSTPPAKPISDDIGITDAAQQLSIQSIAMPAPSYDSGEGVFEKTYRSQVAVDVANSSGQELYLGMEYYADSGSTGFYKPGATSGAKILPVPPKWSGRLHYPLNHVRFVKGGSIRLIFAKCFGPGPEHLHPDSERLFEETYDIVSQQ